MRMRNVVLTMLLAVMVLAAAGCRTAPIYNVQGAPVTPTVADEVTREEIKDAIIRAGSGLGWRMRPQEPGHMLGVLRLRSHVAKVDIRYDTETYSITYRDSTNLDHQNGQIHSNYNGWIQNLDTAIQNEIAAL